MATKNTNNSIKTIKGRLPFKEVVVYPSQEQQRKAAVRRTLAATTPNTNFNNAIDLTNNERKKLNDMQKANWFEQLINGYIRFPYNCINTATGWITNNKQTIARNKNLYDNPEKYGYKEVSFNEAQPGDLMQYISDNVPWHSAVLVSKDNIDKNSKKLLNIKNRKHYTSFYVKSSSGDDKLNPIRHYSLEEIGKENSDLDSMPKFYRYTYPNSGVKFIK